MSPSRNTTDLWLIAVRTFGPLPTLAVAEVHHLTLETESFSRQVSWRVTEVLSASAWQALMESVDYWPMAIIIR
jgi:hypothetical protein